MLRRIRVALPKRDKGILILGFQKKSGLAWDKMQNWAIMPDMQVRPILILVLLTFSFLSAQSNHGRSDGPTLGSLNVKVTVVPSIGLLMDASGTQEDVAANSAGPKQSPAHLKPQKIASKKRSLPASNAQTSAGMPSARHPGNQSNATVQFNLPSPKKFEVREEIVVMDVTENGKTERQPVKVTTVVPR